MNNEKNDRLDEHSMTVNNIDINNNIFVGCQRNIAIMNSQDAFYPIHNVRIRHNTSLNARHLLTDSGAVNLFIAFSDNQALVEKNIFYQNDDEPIGYAPMQHTSIFIRNVWSKIPPAPLYNPASDLVGDPQLQNPAAVLIPGAVDVQWYRPLPASPALADSLGAAAFYTGTPPALPTQLPTATPMPHDTSIPTPGHPPECVPATATPTITPMPTIPASASQSFFGSLGIQGVDKDHPGLKPQGYQQTKPGSPGFCSTSLVRSRRGGVNPLRSG